MKKMFLIAIASAILVSCGQNKEKGQVVNFEQYKNEFDAPATFTMDQVVFYDNEGKPLKYTDKMEVSFTMDLQVDRSKTTINDKSVYYGGPSETRIDKAK
ncbi:MAG: hypothetical protein EOO86_13330 [Pedobacter sp.]|nr:MAG: hypothetical protein EOO86_13330 [Pedobacter sp.]